jgi:hypothetical protein
VSNIEDRRFIDAISVIHAIKADIATVETMVSDQNEKDQRNRTANLILINDGDSERQKVIKTSVTEMLHYVGQSVQIPPTLVYGHLLAISSYQMHGGLSGDDASSGYETASIGSASTASVETNATTVSNQGLMLAPASNQVRSLSESDKDNVAPRVTGCKRTATCNKRDKHVGGCNQLLDPNAKKPRVRKRPAPPAGTTSSPSRNPAGLMMGNLRERFTRSASAEELQQIAKSGTGAASRAMASRG